ncbi:MAG TPA: zf-HC2 domain-containing protein [Blastocatellia bacterium]|nr:zf-HC2 domain-containing protein [Blastocatellia bacterium]HMV84526.1 zf-HC2 domain-containing protein [Blastocatellia bacterium]HMX30027.1 zf-HC2 domain-containing protein [Blastocatellia bacterium]HMY74078.1 zf-HC2 domain-containing protein [Blastocatellia bacterium]HMZ17316.1 zf-HC2 domain-containing protein [Blastocatellia bacterium]
MKDTNKMNSQNACDRKEELVTYLYNEATAAERASFERHLGECEPCGAELKAFGRVREELNTWQVGFAPRTELVLPRGKMEVLRELIGLFPIWARGLAMAGVTAVLAALLLNIGNTVNQTPPGNNQQAAMSQQQIEALVKQAVAEERAKIQQETQAQFASFKAQLDTEHRAQLQAVSAEHRVKLETVRANLKQEIQKSSRQRGSIRSFFAMSEEQQDPWSDSR